MHGARCVLFPGRIPTAAELGGVLHKWGISTLWLTASLFNAAIDEAPEALSGLGQLLIGGEALSVAHVRRAQRLLPATQIINGYGPTESTTFACCYRIPGQIDESLSSVPLAAQLPTLKYICLTGICVLFLPAFPASFILAGIVWPAVISTALN